MAAETILFTIVTRLKVMLEVKKPPANADDIRDTDLILGFGKIPWRRKWQLTPVLLPGRFHGQSSLVGCSPRGRKGPDTTEPTGVHLPCIQAFLKTRIFIYVSSFNPTTVLKG